MSMAKKIALAPNTAHADLPDGLEIQTGKADEAAGENVPLGYGDTA